MTFNTYLVGGAVRDELLGLPVKEKDWLVVGATPDDLLQKNFVCVGKDFPVFLHPETKEEYALARTERKVAPGYTGFEFNTSTDVSLEDDLLRRDLTINAIAQDEKGHLIDPYHGQRDLEKKILRHISPAFAEDPVRILRLARFAARFAHLGFVVASETQQLMKHMVTEGEVDALVAERVWQEFNKALQTNAPAIFFQELKICGALDSLFPAIDSHYQAVLQNLVSAAKCTPDPKIRFAALMLPLEADAITRLCKTYAVPNDFRSLALIARNNKAKLQACGAAQTVLTLLKSLDAFRRPERLQDFLNTMRALNIATEQCDFLQHAYDAAKVVTAKKFIDKGITGSVLGEAISGEQLQMIKDLSVKR